MAFQMGDSPLRVGAAQIGVELFEVERNVEKHLAWIEQARAQGVELLVFPELSLTGYEVGGRGYELGMSLNHPVLRRLAEAAGDMAVVVGFVEEGFAAQFYCSAAFLRAGKVRFVHRKLNLANYGAMEEAKFFAAGRYVETVPVAPPFTATILLCADTWNPALVHLAALHGATMLIVPTNSSLDAASGDFSKPRKWDIVLEFYSVIYAMPIVFANRVGTEGDHTFWGGSRIIDARGEVLARAGREDETLLCADLSYDAVRKARFELPTVRDSNLDLVDREVTRLVSRLGIPHLIRDDP
jgi:N-carbamoylputrescine amidase